MTRKSILVGAAAIVAGATGVAIAVPLTNAGGANRGANASIVPADGTFRPPPSDEAARSLETMALPIDGRTVATPVTLADNVQMAHLRPLGVGEDGSAYFVAPAKDGAVVAGGSATGLSCVVTASTTRGIPAFGLACVPPDELPGKGMTLVHVDGSDMRVHGAQILPAGITSVRVNGDPVPLAPGGKLASFVLPAGSGVHVTGSGPGGATFSTTVKTGWETAPGS